MIENTKDTLEYLKGVTDILFKKTSDTLHSTNIEFTCKKNGQTQSLELIIWSNYKQIKHPKLVNDKDKILINDKELKIIDKQGKSLILEYFLPILSDIVIHLDIKII